MDVQLLDEVVRIRIRAATDPIEIYAPIYMLRYAVHLSQSGVAECNVEIVVEALVLLRHARRGTT